MERRDAGIGEAPLAARGDGIRERPFEAHQLGPPDADRVAVDSLATHTPHPVDDVGGYGLVRRREDGEILEFLEKPDPSDVDSDEIYKWPWLYAVEVGHWVLNDSQARRIRDYLDRGGFLMVDDFHGSEEWEVFTASLKRVFT